MIGIDRNGVAIPSALNSDKESRGAEELSKAADHYRSEEKRIQSLLNPTPKEEEIRNYDFRAYNDKSVKKALEQLFHGKCAYCEARYASTQPMDGEHFRPKGEIVLDSGKILRPGYWWLAAAWANLLPSCIDCNRERGQDELFTDGSEGYRAVKAGKGCKFPLENEDERARSPRARKYTVEKERPLLLDPCEPGLDPADHLDFGLDGHVRPKCDANGIPSQRAVRSIEIYGLFRTELVRDRQQVLRFVQHRIYVIDALAGVLEEPGNLSTDLQNLLADLIEKETEALVKMREDSEPFAQMVRQTTDKFFNRYRP